MGALICRSLQGNCLKSIPWPRARRLPKCDDVLEQLSSWMTFSPMMRLVCPGCVSFVSFCTIVI